MCMHMHMHMLHVHVHVAFIITEMHDLHLLLILSGTRDISKIDQVLSCFN